MAKLNARHDPVLPSVSYNKFYSSRTVPKSWLHVKSYIDGRQIYGHFTFISDYLENILYYIFSVFKGLISLKHVGR